ncbi:MAG: MFS transporter [Nitrososphaerota archaeon]|jgi:putative MFS transporter|nr:MFS transporter [Nitrososphaerota archaeon]MDG6935321.1 MFS transporter [Nitrososphaerota archaeon]
MAGNGRTDWLRQSYLFYTQLSAGSLLVLPSIMLPIYFKIAAYLEGYLFFFEFFGMLIGSLLLPGASDKIGRRPALAVAIMLYSVGSFLPYLNHSFYPLIASMIIMGTGIGANVPIVNAMMNEFSDQKERGTIMSIGNAIFNLGFIIIPLFLLFGAARFIFAYGLIQLISIIPLISVPEITKLNGGGGFNQLYKSSYLKRTLLVSFATFFVFFSVYGIIDWFPTLIYNGIIEVPAFFQKDYIIIANLGAFSGAALMAPFIEKLGRKLLGVLVDLIAGITEMLVGLISGNAILLIAALIFASLLFMEGALAIVTIVSSELYGSEMRGRGLGNSLAWGRIAGMISPLVLGSILEDLKSPALPFLVISISSLAAMSCFLMLPETRYITSHR